MEHTAAAHEAAGIDVAGDAAADGTAADGTTGLDYVEPGASGWALLWGPGFAAVGYLVEVFNGFRPHAVMWVAVALGLLGLSALWVRARRRFLSVAVGEGELRQGTERLPLTRIAEVAVEVDRSAPLGLRVLGGGLSVPRKYDEVPLRLDDDSIVLAWARDGEALRRALRRPRDV